MTGQVEAPIAQSALLFPGQGLPAEDIFNYYGAINDVSDGAVKRYLKEVEEISNIPLVSILENKDGSPLQSTAFMQPVVYALSMAAFGLVRQRDEIAQQTRFVAGHSLGEYAAITAAGVISFEDGMKIVTKRGELMEKACQMRPSRHISILGLDKTQVETVCEQTGTRINLLNAPTNIVIGCSAERVEEITEIIKPRGARRVATLGTAGAFHDPNFMSEAAEGLGEFLRDFEFKDPQYDVVANITGRPSRSGRSLKAHAVESMVNPVQWADSIQFMNREGVIFYEIGPGNFMRALNRQNDVPSEKTKDISSLLV